MWYITILSQLYYKLTVKIKIYIPFILSIVVQVFTIEEMLPEVKDVPGVIAKNMFLYGKKKKDLWLFSCRHDREINLAKLGKIVGAPGGLRFADEAILIEKLGVRQGCVTAFALINDTNNDVKFILDKALSDDAVSEKVNFHPMENNATTAISPTDLAKFLDAVNHKPIIVDLDAE